MVLMNLPRSERFKPENVFLVGVIPGPHEPKHYINNSYLQPLVAELNALWRDGISVKRDGSTEVEKFPAALLCVGCDIPAAKKVCGFTDHGSKKGCSKCKKFFQGTVGTKIDFSGFEPCSPRRNNERQQVTVQVWNKVYRTDDVTLF